MSNKNVDVLAHLKALNDRGYKIKSKLNEGTYAKVYLAEFESPTVTKTQLALKILEVKRKSHKYVMKFMSREISILSQIDHPYIIHTHSILQIEFRFYIFMRLGEMGDLLDFVTSNDQINENQARVWTRQIALAIQYLHQLNIAHRDLKCENILVSINFNLKLSDFGFARYTVDDDQKTIISSTYCGTLLYAAPEIIHGHPYNPKISDLWSIGVILYAMMNKCLPFDEHNVKLLYELQMNKKYKFLSEINSRVSPQLKQLVSNLLEPDTEKRCAIEHVIDSEWILMDQRLTVLAPDELTALSRAKEHPVKQMSVSIPNVRKKSIVGEAPSVVISEIMPYDNITHPRISDNPKLELFAELQSSHEIKTKKNSSK